MRRIIDLNVRRALVVLMIILVIDVLWQVFSRYVLNDPSSFTDELAGFLLIWVGLLGAAYAVGIKKHLAIDFFVHNLTGSRKRAVELLQGSLVVLFCFAVMMVGGSWLVYTRFYLGQVSPALQIPVGYVYIIIPLSGLLMVYYAIDNMLKGNQTTN